MKHATFDVIDETRGVVFIRQRKLEGTMTLRQDASRVVDELLGSFGEKRFVFLDQDGSWWELLHTGIHFRGFESWNEAVPA